MECTCKPLGRAIGFLHGCAMDRIRATPPTVYVAGRLARVAVEIQATSKAPEGVRLRLYTSANPVTPRLVASVAALCPLAPETLDHLNQLARPASASELRMVFHRLAAADAAVVMACLCEASRRCQARDDEKLVQDDPALLFEPI